MNIDSNQFPSSGTRSRSRALNKLLTNLSTPDQDHVSVSPSHTTSGRPITLRAQSRQHTLNSSIDSNIHVDGKLNLPAGSASPSFSNLSPTQMADLPLPSSTTTQHLRQVINHLQEEKPVQPALPNGGRVGSSYKYGSPTSPHPNIPSAPQQQQQHHIQQSLSSQTKHYSTPTPSAATVGIPNPLGGVDAIKVRYAQQLLIENRGVSVCIPPPPATGLSDLHHIFPDSQTALALGFDLSSESAPRTVHSSALLEYGIPLPTSTGSSAGYPQPYKALDTKTSSGWGLIRWAEVASGFGIGPLSSRSGVSAARPSLGVITRADPVGDAFSESYDTILSNAVIAEASQTNSSSNAVVRYVKESIKPAILAIKRHNNAVKHNPNNVISESFMSLISPATVSNSSSSSANNFVNGNTTLANTSAIANFRSSSNSRNSESGAMSGLGMYPANLPAWTSSHTAPFSSSLHVDAQQQAEIFSDKLTIPPGNNELRSHVLLHDHVADRFKIESYPQINRDIKGAPCWTVTKALAPQCALPANLRTVIPVARAVISSLQKEIKDRRVATLGPRRDRTIELVSWAWLESSIFDGLNPEELSRLHPEVIDLLNVTTLVVQSLGLYISSPALFDSAALTRVEALKEDNKVQPEPHRITFDGKVDSVTACKASLLLEEALKSFQTPASVEQVLHDNIRSVQHAREVQATCPIPVTPSNTQPPPSLIVSRLLSASTSPAERDRLISHVNAKGLIPGIDAQLGANSKWGRGIYFLLKTHSWIKNRVDEGGDSSASATTPSVTGLGTDLKTERTSTETPKQSASCTHEWRSFQLARPARLRHPRVAELCPEVMSASSPQFLSRQKKFADSKGTLANVREGSETVVPIPCLFAHVSLSSSSFPSASFRAAARDAHAALRTLREQEGLSFTLPPDAPSHHHSSNYTGSGGSAYSAVSRLPILSHSRLQSTSRWVSRIRPSAAAALAHLEGIDQFGANVSACLFAARDPAQETKPSIVLHAGVPDLSEERHAPADILKKSNLALGAPLPLVFGMPILSLGDCLMLPSAREVLLDNVKEDVDGRCLNNNEGDDGSSQAGEGSDNLNSSGWTLIRIEEDELVNLQRHAGHRDRCYGLLLDDVLPWSIMGSTPEKILPRALLGRISGLRWNGYFDCCPLSNEGDDSDALGFRMSTWAEIRGRQRIDKLLSAENDPEICGQSYSCETGVVLDLTTDVIVEGGGILEGAIGEAMLASSRVIDNGMRGSEEDLLLPEDELITGENVIDVAEDPTCQNLPLHQICGRSEELLAGGLGELSMHDEEDDDLENESAEIGESEVDEEGDASESLRAGFEEEEEEDDTNGDEDEDNHTLASANSLFSNAFLTNFQSSSALTLDNKAILEAVGSSSSQLQKHLATKRDSPSMVMDSSIFFNELTSATMNQHEQLSLLANGIEAKAPKRSESHSN